MTTPTGIKTGFGAVEQSIADAKARGNFTGRLDYFKLDENEIAFVRFLTDAVITADFAERVKGPDGKYQSFAVLDPSNNHILKYVQEGNWDGKLKSKTAGIAVIRDRRPKVIPGAAPDARPQYEYFDKEEIRDDGSRARKFVLVLQSHKNFWDPMVGFNNLYSTITDRDYCIQRIGQKLETDYRIGPIDPDPNDPLRDPAKLAEAYGYGRPWDKDDPNRFWWCPQTLPEWIEQYGSEDRVKHFLMPSAAQPEAQQPPQQASAPTQGFVSGPQGTSVAVQVPPGGGWAGSGIDEFSPANTSNPAAVAAPEDDQDFATLRGRLGPNK